MHVCTALCYCPICPPQYDRFANRTDHLLMTEGERTDEGVRTYMQCGRCGFRRATIQTTDVFHSVPNV